MGQFEEDYIDRVGLPSILCSVCRTPLNVIYADTDAGDRPCVYYVTPCVECLRRYTETVEEFGLDED